MYCLGKRQYFAYLTDNPSVCINFIHIRFQSALFMAMSFHSHRMSQKTAEDKSSTKYFFID